MDSFKELFPGLIELLRSLIIADGQSNVIELLKGNAWLEVLLGLRQ